MKKYLFLVLLSILILGCKKEKYDELKLVIGYIPHVQFTPLYVGINNKIFEKYGIRLNINYGFGLDAFTMLESRNADIALSDSDQLLIANSKGLKLYPIFQYYKRYPVSLVAIEKGIEKIEDFKNKKIGVPEFAGTSYIGLLKLLEINNFLDDVKIERVGYTQVESLESKKVDGVICFYNNEPIKLRKTYPDLKEWALKDYVDLAGASFIVSKNQIDIKKDLLNSFVKAMEESILWTLEHQKEALDISYQMIGNLQQDDMEFWTEVLDNTLKLIMTDDDKNTIGKIDSNIYLKTYEELVNLKLIENEYNVDEYLKF